MTSVLQSIDYTFSPWECRSAAAEWRAPLAWNTAAQEFEDKNGRRPRVLCISKPDLFDPSVGDSALIDLFAMIKMTPGLDWLIPTERLDDVAGIIADTCINGELPENAFLGAIISSQEQADASIPALLGIDAEGRFAMFFNVERSVDLSRWTDPTGVHCVDVCADTPYVLDGEVQTVPGHGNTVEPLCPKCGLVASWTGYDSGLDLVVVAPREALCAPPMFVQLLRGLRDQCAADRVPLLLSEVQQLQCTATVLPLPNKDRRDETELSDWQGGDAKPALEGSYLREFEEGEAVSEFIDGEWKRDGFFPSDVQNVRWRGLKG